MSNPIHIVGGGLAGSEAAWQIAEAGVPVVLHEMRPVRMTDAHRTQGLAELVCSNSFRSDDHEMNAVGQIHWEMRALGSLIMRMADTHQVPAGSALAVDRDGFSDAVSAALGAHPLVTIERGEIAGLPPQDWDNVIVATGPLTSSALAEAIRARTGADSLAFFDAIAPIVYRESVDMDVAWFQSRYDKAGPGGTGADYLNCPMDRDQYEAFIDALLAAEKTEFKEWEGTPYFDGCLPIEVMAERGRETLRHGPMKPVGLTNPHQPDIKPYAVVQLRQDNAIGTLFNIVGFQTKLKYGAQSAVFRMIPGLEKAEFARLGGIHRNTYLDSSSPARRHAAAQGGAAPALRRPDHGLRRLCRKRRRRPDGGPLRCCGAPGSPARRAATGNRHGRLAQPHHWRAHLDDRCRSPLLPAHEHQFRSLRAPIEAPGRGPDGKRLRGPEKAAAKKRSLTARAKASMLAWRDGAPAVAAE